MTVDGPMPREQRRRRELLHPPPPRLWWAGRHVHEARDGRDAPRRRVRLVELLQPVEELHDARLERGQRSLDPRPRRWRGRGGRPSAVLLLAVDERAPARGGSRGATTRRTPRASAASARRPSATFAPLRSTAHSPSLPTFVSVSQTRRILRATLSSCRSSVVPMPPYPPPTARAQQRRRRRREQPGEPRASAPADDARRTIRSRQEERQSAILTPRRGGRLSSRTCSCRCHRCQPRGRGRQRSR